MWKKKACVLFAGIALVGLASSSYRAQPSAALTGIVSSDAEGAIEGVLVSAKRPGSTITLTVVSGKQGRFTFPAGSLKPGQYSVAIRAIGYELAAPNTVVTLGDQGTECDLKLSKTRDLASQLSSAEWVMSVPGTPEQKDGLYGCMSCHTLTPVVKSTYDAAGWVTTLVRMRNYETASSLSSPRLLPYREGQKPKDVEFGKYLSSINLSSKGQWDFQLKTLPRPAGKATRVMITEYDLPRPDAEPHDALIDPDGMIWYDDFALPLLGRLDPRTGETKEWTLPELKPGFPNGSLNLALDRDGNLWIARAFQAGIVRFDRKTEKITSWSEPAEYNNLHSRTTFLAPTLDGRVWFADTFNRLMHLLDPATGHIATYRAYPDWKMPDWDHDAAAGGKGKESHGHFIYGIAADSKGRGYFADMAGGNIGEIDPETGKVTLYPTPSVNSGPRRMHMDAQDRLWFGEDYAGKIGLFDTKTKQFKEWKTYSEPMLWDDDYDAVSDKEGFVWTGGWTSDLVTRLNPNTGDITQYLLPRLGVNIRGVNIDNSTTPPTFLVGENHQAKIARVQPLE